eukprot:1181033-Prorocentrum_minimum.AAC.2
MRRSDEVSSTMRANKVDLCSTDKLSRSLRVIAGTIGNIQSARQAMRLKLTLDPVAVWKYTVLSSVLGCFREDVSASEVS